MFEEEKIVIHSVTIIQFSQGLKSQEPVGLLWCKYKVVHYDDSTICPSASIRWEILFKNCQFLTEDEVGQYQSTGLSLKSKQLHSFIPFSFYTAIKDDPAIYLIDAPNQGCQTQNTRLINFGLA